MKMETTTKIFKNVKIGKNCKIGEFVIIGEPPRGVAEGKLETIIGDNAIVRSHTVIYAGNKIGKNFQTGHGVLIREENEIGNNVSVGSHSVVEHRVRIADNCRIHSNAFIPEFSELQEGAWIGPNVVLTNAKYPKSRDAKKNLIGPIVCRNAKIGANSTILPGVVIGEGALVGAGSVVAKDVEKESIVVGTSAKKVGLVGTPYK